MPNIPAASAPQYPSHQKPPKLELFLDKDSEDQANNEQQLEFLENKIQEAAIHHALQEQIESEIEKHKQQQSAAGFHHRFAVPRKGEPVEAKNNAPIAIPAAGPPQYAQDGLLFLRPEQLDYMQQDGRPRTQQEEEDEAAMEDYAESVLLNGLVGDDDRVNNAFERRERLDVKKPGPWYRTVNNFAFDDENHKKNKVKKYCTLLRRA